MEKAKPLLTWRYPSIFWIANGSELLERAAYYGTFISLAVFLTRVVGYSDVAAGWIGAVFAATIYFLPTINGAIADLLGFRASLMLAFFLLSMGYGGLSLFPTKGWVLIFLACIAIGGAFVKPIITGTVAKSSDEINRARAYSIFYMVVNIGAFSGKTIARPVRVALGVEYVPLYSAGAAFLAFLLVTLLYHPKAVEPLAPSSLKETFRNMAKALSHLRFLALILITAGFWMIQGQLYASMPKYVLRMVGEGASPEWYANVNPFIVVLFVVPITHLVRKMKPESSIAIALGLIPLSALLMSLSHLFSAPVMLFSKAWHPITIMMVAGIALQGLAECFLSPRYYEFASKLAPKGQEGLYLGYAHLNTFFAWFIGFALSGYLLDAFCPNPATLSPKTHFAYTQALKGIGQMPEAYRHAHVIWYVFAGIGFLAFLALLGLIFLSPAKKNTDKA